MEGLRFLSVCDCVCSQTFWTTNNIGTSIELPTDLKLYKDQNTFLTIAVSPLSEVSGSKSTHNSSCLQAIAIEALLKIEHNQGSGCTIGIGTGRGARAPPGVRLGC